MRDEPNKTVWPWLVGALLCVPVLYVVLLGPTCWLADRGIISSAEAYRPAARLAAKQPGAVRDAYSCYTGLGSPHSRYTGYGARDNLELGTGHAMLKEEWRVYHPPEGWSP